MADIPVYLVAGFLDGGKTDFINGILQDGFARKDRTLLLCCEEGELEYDARVLNNVTVVTIEDEEDLKGSIRWLVPTAQKNQMEPILVEMEGGGTTDSSDPHAPKTIASTELTRFYAAFLSKPAVDKSLLPQGKCILEMRAEADGALVTVVCMNSGIDLCFTADKAALSDLQALIQKQDLAAINGHSKRNTARGTYLDLTVEYASGERIHAYAEGGASTAPPKNWNPAVFTAFFQQLCESNDVYPAEASAKPE